jgi:hypothetical protein
MDQKSVQFWLDARIREAQAHVKGDHGLVSPDCDWCLMRMLGASEESILIHANAYLDVMPKEILARAAKGG